VRRRLRGALRRALDRLVKAEVIGQEECPMMVRWSLWLPGPRDAPWIKVLIHYFPPNVSDRDPHDHPRSFLTFILRGRYFNTEWVEVNLPDQKYMAEMELVEAGRVIYRRADHTHIVETDDYGCWTLVVMGPEHRKWGFLRGDRWIPFRRYIDLYGGVTRCESNEPG
jgi:hypothetical protein